MKYLLVLLPLLLVGCGERYRYPCQDPTNWDQQICKRPYCSANGTCPDDLTHYEKQGEKQATILPKVRKGECL
jgi:hypothetical protein